MKLRKTHQQLILDDARKPTGRGGWRPGAGRPKAAWSRVAHGPREEFSSREPLHVTLRIRDDVPALRDLALLPLIRGQIAQSHRDDYRVNEFVVEDTHLHVLSEAEHKQALERGVGSMESRIARRLNRAFGRSGRVFDDRYHYRVLRTPREVRNALCYVLNNERHHADERGELMPSDWIDPFSSAAWFGGWASPIDTREEWKRDLLAVPSPVAAPRTWLLNVGWRKHGLLRFDEIPGRRKKRSR